MKHLQIILFGERLTGAYFSRYMFVDEFNCTDNACPDIHMDMIASESDAYLSVYVFLCDVGNIHIANIAAYHLTMHHGYNTEAPIEYEMFRRRAQNRAEQKYSLFIEDQDLYKNEFIFRGYNTDPVSLYAFRGGFSDSVFDHPLMINREYMISTDQPSYLSQKNRTFYSDYFLERIFNEIWYAIFDDNNYLPAFILFITGALSYGFFEQISADFDEDEIKNRLYRFFNIHGKLISEASVEYTQTMKMVGVLT